MNVKAWIKSHWYFILIVVAAFLAGRYSLPEKVVIQTKIVTQEVEKQDTAIDQDRVSDVVHILKPDGTKITEIHVEAKKDIEQKKDISIAQTVDQTKTVEYRRGVYVQAMVGLPLSSISSGAVFGVSASKQVWGPIVLGAWGFTDLRVGLSGGLEL